MSKFGTHITLGEYVYSLVKLGKQNSAEFIDLEKCYGRDKLRELYVVERDKQEAIKNSQVPIDFRKESAGDK